MAQSPSTLLTIRDAALATGLTPKALRRRIERGTLASVYANDRRWIAMDELLRQGLLVPLDAQGNRQAPPPTQQRRAGGREQRGVGTRLSALEQRLAIAEAQIAELSARLAVHETPADEAER